MNMSIRDKLTEVFRIHAIHDGRMGAFRRKYKLDGIYLSGMVYIAIGSIVSEL